jgi:mRNA interferase RelE/StbE
VAYSIHFKPSVAKTLAKLPRDAQRRIATRIEQLIADPRPQGVEKLKGKDNLYRVRAGDYRIIYTIEDDKLVVLIVSIGHRRDIYRDLK